MEMYSLTFVSSAVKPFTTAELHELLILCTRNNTRDDITGLMLYKDGSFMQAFEGEQEVVMATYARMHEDRRHDGMITLHQGPQGARQFPGWSMGFKNLDSAGDKPASYSEFLNSPLTAQEFSATPNRAQKLLLSFREQP
jgi:Sensors of blue-light using FAD